MLKVINQKLNKLIVISVISVIISISHTLIINYLFLKSLGKHVYSDWIVIISIVSIVGFIFSNFIYNYQYNLANKRGHADEIKIFHSNFYFLLILSIYTVTFLFFFLNFAYIFYYDLEYFDINNVNLIIFFFSKIFYVLFNFKVSYLRFESKYKKLLTIFAVYSIIRFVIYYIVLILNLNLFSLIFSDLLLNILYFIYYSNKKNFIHFTIKKNISLNKIRIIIKELYYRIQFSIGNNFKTSIEILIVSSFFSKDKLIFFFTANSVIQFLNLVCIKVKEIFYENISLILNENSLHIRKQNYLYIIINFILTLFLSSIVLIIIKDFYLFWFKGEIEYDGELFLCLLIANLIHNLNLSITDFHNLNNNLRDISKYYLFYTIISLSLMLILVQDYSILVITYINISVNIILFLFFYKVLILKKNIS